MVKKDSILITNLSAICALLERELSLTGISFSNSDAWNREIKNNLAKNASAIDKKTKSVSFPYFYASLGNISTNQEVAAGSYATRRYGRQMVEQQAGLSDTKVLRVFPLKFTVNVHYIDNDMYRTLDFIERCLIISTTGLMSVTIKLGGIPYATSLEIPKDIPIETATLENASLPGARDTVLAIQCNSYGGWIEAVPSVNGKKPQVNFDFNNPILEGL